MKISIEKMVIDNVDEEKLFLYMGRICSALEKIADNKLIMNEQSNRQNRQDIIGVSKAQEAQQEQTVLDEVQELPDNGVDMCDGDGASAEDDDRWETSQYDYEYLSTYLSDKNIITRKVTEPQPYDDTLDIISKYIGSKYELVKPLLDKIKQNVATGGAFELNLKEYGDKAVSAMCQLCNNLYGLGIMTEYKYWNSPRFLLRARPSSDFRSQNFLNGGWMERYVIICIKEAMNKLKSRYMTDYGLFRNVEVELPNGRSFEYDIMLFVNDHCYWFECKSGSYQDSIAKYSEICQKYGFDKDRSFIVLTSANAGIYNALGFYNMTPINIKDFAERITEVLSADCEEHLSAIE